MTEEKKHTIELDDTELYLVRRACEYLKIKYKDSILLSEKNTHWMYRDLLDKLEEIK